LLTRNIGETQESSAYFIMQEMKEITKNLFIGSQEDYENDVKHKEGWFVIHACKEPYHRQALGYTGRAVSKSHPEYLIARRLGRLILNLIDADTSAFIPSEVIDATIAAIGENIPHNKVLVHCNQGLSRSATIGLLYLHHAGIIPTADFTLAEEEYRKLYPLYAPSRGLRSFAQMNWRKYKK